MSTVKTKSHIFPVEWIEDNENKIAKVLVMHEMLVEVYDEVVNKAGSNLSPELIHKIEKLLIKL